VENETEQSLTLALAAETGNDPSTQPARAAHRWTQQCPAWWLSEPNGGEEFAYALLAASCAAEVTTEHVYLALITPPEKGV
jgi:hypothetical protein